MIKQAPNTKTVQCGYFKDWSDDDIKDTIKHLVDCGKIICSAHMQRAYAPLFNVCKTRKISISKLMPIHKPNGAYILYTIKSASSKLCYVGITKQNPQVRYNAHLSSFNCRSRLVLIYDDATFEVVSQNVNPKTCEQEYANKMIADGWQIVNDPRTYGFVNNGSKKYTDDMIKEAISLGNGNIANAYMLFPKMFHQYAHRSNTSITKLCNGVPPDVEYFLVGLQLNASYTTNSNFNAKITAWNNMLLRNKQKTIKYTRAGKFPKTTPKSLKEFLYTIKPLVNEVNNYE